MSGSLLDSSGQQTKCQQYARQASEHNAELDSPRLPGKKSPARGLGAARGASLRIGTGINLRCMDFMTLS